MMYTITTFIADHTPTRYEKPLGGGAALPVGKETVIEYETYDDCKAQMVSYSHTLATEKEENVKKLQKVWTSYKMYRKAKQPSLLHYIDNNYPGLSLSSEAGEKM